MPTISDIAAALKDLLSTGPFDPPLREITTGSALPPVTYPSAAITVNDELFSPQPADVTALVSVRLVCAGGRSSSAREKVRSLAHQVRRALYGSVNLYGKVKSVSVARISYGGESPAEETGPVIATAVIELELRYCEPEQ